MIDRTTGDGGSIYLLSSALTFVYKLSIFHADFFFK